MFKNNLSPFNIPKDKYQNANFNYTGNSEVPRNQDSNQLGYHQYPKNYS
jgi:hypothetical protein